MVKKKAGRALKSNTHLLEVRAFAMQLLAGKGLSNTDIAFIFNVHPSQVTRSLKNK